MNRRENFKHAHACTGAWDMQLLAHMRLLAHKHMQLLALKNMHMDGCRSHKKHAAAGATKTSRCRESSTKTCRCLHMVMQLLAQRHTRASTYATHGKTHGENEAISAKQKQKRAVQCNNSKLDGDKMANHSANKTY